MSEQNIEKAIDTNSIITSSSKEIEDYADILQLHDLNYKVIDYYLQVGEITKIQGWILHISTVISEITTMLEVVLPTLTKEGVTFKIVINKRNWKKYSEREYWYRSTRKNNVHHIQIPMLMLLS